MKAGLYNVQMLLGQEGDWQLFVQLLVNVLVGKCHSLIFNSECSNV